MSNTLSSVALLAAPASVNLYEIDLSQGKIIGANGTESAEITEEVITNSPGLLRVVPALSAPEDIEAEVYSIIGKLVLKETIHCQPKEIIEISMGNNALYLCKIGNRSYTMVGREGNPDEIRTRPHHYSPSKTNDFIYTPGDEIRFTATKTGMYSNYVSYYPNDGDTVTVFISTPCPGTPTVTDYEGNVYPTLQIGSRCWMRENIRSKRYSDGTPLLDGTGVGEIGGNFVWNMWFNYNDDPANASLYGLLYTGAGAFNDYSTPNGICPAGWHVATTEEWCEMERRFDPTITHCITGAFIGFVGNYIRHRLCDDNAVSGFRKQYAGVKFESGYFGGLGAHARWWCNKEDVAWTQAGFRMVDIQEPGINRDHTFTDIGYSVRCVKD